MSSPAVPACRNCGAPADGNFCPGCGQDTKAHPPSARAFLHEFAQRFRRNFGGMTRAQAAEFISHRLVGLFPYAMFVLLPVFALLTRTVYWNRPFNYGEHLVFALHVHAAVFFIGAIAEPLRMPILWTVPSAMYLFAAMAHVFGGRKVPMILRATFVFVLYFILVIATIVAIVTGSALL